MRTQYIETAKHWVCEIQYKDNIVVSSARLRIQAVLAAKNSLRELMRNEQTDTNKGVTK